jgi:hypothetical protein
VHAHARLGFASSLFGSERNAWVFDSERWLLFPGASADAGSHLDLDHQILLGGDNGPRGYPLRCQGGEERRRVTAEQRFFTNWYPFRLFNDGAAAFADVGRPGVLMNLSLVRGVEDRNERYKLTGYRHSPCDPP